MTDLAIDPADLPPREVYHLLTAVVVPRPIAWVGTVSTDGIRNLAPHSYFNLISHDPPIVHVTSSGVKDTLRNVQATGELTVNIVSAHQLEAMNTTAADLPPDEDEFIWSGLESEPSETVTAPRVKDAKVSLECHLHSVLSIGTGNMIFANVDRIRVASDVWVDGRVDPELLAPVARLSGSLYGFMDRLVRLPRPTWADLKDAPP